MVRALVAGGVDYGESDRVVHLLTEHGSLTAFAPGAKKSQRRFRGALEPFTSVDLHLHQNKNRAGLPTITEAIVQHPRLAIRSELDRILVAAYVTELGRSSAPEKAPSESLLELVESVLDRLADAPARRAVRSAFELCLLEILGYLPYLEACVLCENSVPEVGALDFQKGGLLCGACGQKAHPVGPKTIAWMRAVLSQNEGFDELRGFDEDTASKAAEKLRPALSQFYEQLLGRRLKSAAVLDQARLCDV